MRLTDDLIEARDKATVIDLPNAIQKAIDCLAMLCQVNRDVNAWRKSNLQTELNPEFRQICLEKPEDSDEPWLFENLKDKLKDLNETEKLSSSLKQNFWSRMGRNQPHNPYLNARRGRGMMQMNMIWANPYYKRPYNVSRQQRGTFRKRPYATGKPFLGQGNQKKPQKKY
jgi:hypothetical protein